MVSAPAVVIRLELEAAPRVLADICNEAEERRLLDWLQTRPDYLTLIVRALELEREAA